MGSNSWISTASFWASQLRIWGVASNMGRSASATAVRCEKPRGLTGINLALYLCSPQRHGWEDGDMRLGPLSWDPVAGGINCFRGITWIPWVWPSFTLVQTPFFEAKVVLFFRNWWQLEADYVLSVLFFAFLFGGVQVGRGAILEKLQLITGGEATTSRLYPPRMMQ